MRIADLDTSRGDDCVPQDGLNLLRTPNQTLHPAIPVC